MKFGGIELGGEFGGYEIINEPANSLPQAVASAVGIVNSGILGATYLPVWYVGKQVVNGINHFIICEQVRATKNKDKGIVGLVINIPPGDGSMKGEGASVVKIIEEEKLPADVRAAFETAAKSLVGVSYKAVAYIGRQVVRGVNHYIMCEGRAIYPGAEPFAAVMAVNVFEGNVSIVGVAPVKAAGDKSLFGYAFTW